MEWMANTWRRYEVLFPLQFNDGRDVPDDWLESAVLELVDRFGAASPETQPLAGHWRQQHHLFREKMVRVVVDIPDTPENRQWMCDFRARWQQRLVQIKLWMVSYEIVVE
jgi:hypothetical protein